MTVTWELYVTVTGPLCDSYLDVYVIVTWELQLWAGSEVLVPVWQGSVRILTTTSGHSIPATVWVFGRQTFPANNTVTYLTVMWIKISVSL